MKLQLIISELEVLKLSGSVDRDIRSVVFDSRQVEKDDLFVAVRGTETDGHLYIDRALTSGAAAVVCEEDPGEENMEATWIRVPDSRRALALMASAIFGHPSRELMLVGITGTNGKTTVATLLYQMHSLLGYRAGLLSTIQVLVGSKSFPATHTTPDPVRINSYLRSMVEEGCEYCFMEVSSHAIAQERTAGLEFNGGVFTNLTRDHLDYHGDFREYLNTKKRFFDALPGNAFVLVNGDDTHSQVMVQNCAAEKFRYSLRSMSEFRGKINEMHLEGSSLMINNEEVWVNLPGRFNASNLLCVFAATVLLGQHPEDVVKALSRLEPVRGRFETYRSTAGTTAVVDYAHTPDALQHVLDTINEVNVAGGKIITVVGAGGNRDRGKRPRMAHIAAEASHRLILTSDNPRFEDPAKIMDDMMEGVPESLQGNTLRIINREEAIRTACMMAGENDIILVAGKGHEQTQEIGGEKHPFDDLDIVKKNLRGS